MVDMRTPKDSDARIAIEASAILNLPKSRADLESLDTIEAEQECVELRFLQSIQLCDHGCPTTLDQWA